MEITRKSFLAGAAAGLAVLTLRPAEALGAPAGELAANAYGLRRAVGETFWARGSRGVPVPIRLERVADGPAKGGAEQFSLIFSTDEEHALREGIWSLEAASGYRRYEVFLVPAGTEPSGRRLFRADFALVAGGGGPSTND